LASKSIGQQVTQDKNSLRVEVEDVCEISMFAYPSDRDSMSKYAVWNNKNSSRVGPPLQEMSKGVEPMPGLLVVQMRQQRRRRAKAMQPVGTEPKSCRGLGAVDQIG
jgi:hypothetical protein